MKRTNEIQTFAEISDEIQEICKRGKEISELNLKKRQGICEVNLIEKFKSSVNKITEHYEDKDFSPEKKKILNNMYRYAIKSEKTAWSLKKGLFLQGNVGAGKTDLMKIYVNFLKSLKDFFDIYFSRSTSVFVNKQEQFIFHKLMQILYEKPILFVNSFEICDSYEAKGEVNQYRDADLLIIDEIGREGRITLNMGNKKDIIKNLIEARYKAFKVDKSKKTCFITNYSLAELTEIYGEATISRIVEMTNFVGLQEPNHRIKHLPIEVQQLLTQKIA